MNKKVKNAQDVLEVTCDKIINLMKTEKGDWSKGYSSAGIPMNGYSKTPYRGINHFMLSMICFEEGYDSNEWMTYKQAQQGGYSIIPNKDMPNGSTAQKIIFFKPMKKGEKYFTDYDRAQVAQGKTPMIPLLKMYTVFHASQIDGYEPVKTVKACVSELSAEKTAEIDEFFHAIGSVVKTGSPCYIPSIDEIRMPERESFHSDVRYYGTLGHEEIHRTGHESRLKRFKRNASFGTEARAFEELVAEIGTVLLTSQLGIETTVRKHHLQYLNSWIKVLENDKKAMYRAFSQAQKAVDFLNECQEEKQANVA